MKQWTFGKHFITSIIVLLIFFLSKYASSLLAGVGIIGIDIFSPHEAASVAIISGSDGPTAIYTSGYKGLVYSYGEYLVALIIMLILYLPFSRYLDRVYNRSL